VAGKEVKPANVNLYSYSDVFPFSSHSVSHRDPTLRPTRIVWHDTKCRIRTFKRS
jgi:hypothetical protein